MERGELRGKDVMMTFMLLDSLVLFSHMIRPALELICPGETSEQLF